MQWEYVYADLQLQVTFDADGTSPFGQLTDIEVETLQQLTYMTLLEFLYVRALYAKDIDGLKKIMESLNKNTNILEDGT